MSLNEKLKGLRTRFVFTTLLKFSRIVLNKHKPLVISVTGSVGKTTTTEFVYHVLNNKYKAKKTDINNNFRGTSCTVLGCGSMHTLKRLTIELPTFFKKILFTDKDYPELLVLEQGISKIGQMDKFCKNIYTDIAIITAISLAHSENLKNIDIIAREKGRLVENVSKNGYVILNYDDEKVRTLSKISKGRVIFFGLSEKADVNANNLSVTLDGLKFDLRYNNKSYLIEAKNLFNKHHIYSILAAIASGLVLKIKIEDIIKEIEKLKTVKGRGNILKQDNGVYIINDTYNSSPKSCLASLENLNELGKSKYKIAVLGDMLELGNHSEREHRKVGKKASKIADQIICVGKNSKFIAEEIKNNDVNDKKVTWFNNSEEAADYLIKNITPNAIILVKGSHGVKMDKIIKKFKAY